MFPILSEQKAGKARRGVSLILLCMDTKTVTADHYTYLVVQIYAINGLGQDIVPSARLFIDVIEEVVDPAFDQLVADAVYNF